MIIRGMVWLLIFSCGIITLALVIFPLFVSYKAEKENEWDKIKKYSKKINSLKKKNK